MSWRKNKKIHSLFCTCKQCIKRERTMRHGRECHCRHCCSLKDKKSVKNFYLLILGSILAISILV